MKIALLGAESSGKSHLAQALSDALHVLHGSGQSRHSNLQASVVVVDEYLREWCQAQGRTPQVHEQAHIAHTQAQRIAHASEEMDKRIAEGIGTSLSTPLAHPSAAAYLIADTTAFMTAVYSDVYFGDSSLYPFALQSQHRFDLTLLCAIDLPWQSDGWMRDGHTLRERVDARLRQTLAQHNIRYAEVHGTGQSRTDCAMKALSMLEAW